MTWAPLGMEAGDLDVLVEGVPDWMSWSVWEWIRANLDPSIESQATRIAMFDLVTRRSPPLHPIYLRDGFGALRLHIGEDELLQLVDFILATDPLRPQVLKDILLFGGSAWTVGERARRGGLERRVPGGVSDAVDYTIAQSASAGALLSEAWAAAFGRAPDPEEAYEKAIKAVEEAGAHVVSPKNTGATLGTMCRDMEAQGGWRLPLGEVARNPSNDAAIKMARALWSGQESRHGGNGYRKPTQEEAEAAVLLAVPLVQWFTSGVLARR